MVSEKKPFFNRETSWLSFNQRVSYQAENLRHPLLERLKFISIFFTNMDEFFMIRVAGLERRLELHLQSGNEADKTPLDQLKEIRKQVKSQLTSVQAVLYEDILPKLKSEDVEFKTCAELSKADSKLLEEYFVQNIMPTLIPLAFDPGHPFPFISNLSLSLAVQVKAKGNSDYHFARIKIPPSLSRLIDFNTLFEKNSKNKKTYIWIEDVVSHFIERLFPNMMIESVNTFRITRDADIEIEEDEAADLLESIEESIRKRKYGKIVRLEITPGMPEYIKKILITNLDITERQVYTMGNRLGLSALIDLLSLDIPKLKDAPFLPKNKFEHISDDVDYFSEIKKKEILLYHPYDSFSSVVNFLEQAASDPNVITIKQTLYRVGSKSPIVQALMKAAQRGKQVAAIVELKARFDEENNIEWAKQLEQVGVHVVYGLVGLKVHSKLLLIVRKEGKSVQRYVHLGTGNYNPNTSKIYTDYSFFTTDEEIVSDISDVFNLLTGYSLQREFRKVMVSPISIRKGLQDKIIREMKHKQHGRIIIKINALVDTEIIKLLYQASSVGVKIDLIVRGVCSLVPGVKDISETINVTSIIGRFLEHSRVFYFQNNGAEEIYLGSADIMERNLDRRIEVLFPVSNKELVEKLKKHLDILLQDNQTVWVLDSNGKYKITQPSKTQVEINNHNIFLKEDL